MTPILKIVISVAVAAVATALTTLLAGDGHGTPLLFATFCAATIATAVLVSIPATGATAAPGTKNADTGKTRKPAAAKSSPRAAPAAATTDSDGAREHGQVKWFNVSKGFGFITKDNGEEIFVHFRSIRGGGRRGLRDGQKVSFIVANSDKGPQAEDVEGLE